MRRFLFPSLLIGTLVGGALVAFAIWKASPSSSEEYFKSGKQYYEDKKYSEATIQLLNAVQTDVRNREARFLLAQSYLSQGDLGSSARQLQSLLEYFPDDTESKLLLGSIYLSVGSVRRERRDLFQEASRLAETILDKDPSNVKALVLSGNASAGLQDYETSLEQFEKAISLDPNSPSALVSLGSTEALRSNFGEAEEAFQKALELDPKNRGGLISLANFYRVRGEIAKSEETYRQALDLYPKDSAIYGPLAVLYSSSGRLQEAIDLLEKSQAQDLKNPQPSFMLADIYSARQETEKSQQVLLKLKNELPDNLDVAARLAVSLLVHDPNRAQAEIDQILAAQPQNPAALLLRGELEFFAGKYDVAEATLSQPPVLSSRYPEVQFFLGNIAVAKGNLSSAQNYYNEAINRNGSYLPARAALASVQLDLGKLADARVTVNQVLDASPNLIQARLVKAVLDRREKRYSEAEAELFALLKDQPQSSQIHQQMGAYYADRGRIAEAERSYRRAVELSPTVPQYLRDLVLFLVQSKQSDKAIQTISAVPEKQAYHYELLGSIYNQQEKLAEAERAFKQALEMEPRRSAPNAALASLYVRERRFDEALKELDELLAKDPSNATAHSTKGMIYQDQDKQAEAKQSYNRALQIDPETFLAANNLAYILAEEGTELDRALALAQTAKREQPNVGGVADTLGWVYFKLGNNVLAREQLRFALSKEPDNPLFHYHLGMIYKQNDQKKEAADALRRAVTSTKEFKERPFAEAALKEVTN